MLLLTEAELQKSMLYSEINLKHLYSVMHLKNRTSYVWLKPWVVCFSAALFFFYEFIQMNFFNSLSTEIVNEFSLTPEQLGYLSAFYFYANLIFLFPAGLLLDRFSTRRIILTTMLICITGTFLFSLSQNFWQAAFSRFITGIGSAFCFLSAIRLASRWFPIEKMALIAGLIVTLAMAGGIVAQTPITMLSEWIGWRHTILIDGMVGIILFAVIFIFVQDYNCENKNFTENTLSPPSPINFWLNLKLSYLNPQNWFCGIYTSLMNSPIAILGSLWGSLYLEKKHFMEPKNAATISAMIFIGTIIGSPFFGAFSPKG